MSFLSTLVHPGLWVPETRVAKPESWVADVARCQIPVGDERRRLGRPAELGLVVGGDHAGAGVGVRSCVSSVTLLAPLIAAHPIP
jgi:hypothetical protein